MLERESRDARRTERAAASQSKPRTPRERAGPKALVPGGVSEVSERAALLTDPLTAPNLPGLNQRYPANAAKSLNHSRFPEVAVVQTLCITTGDHIMQITAINPKHQRAIDALYAADRRYCALVNDNAERLNALDPDSDRYAALAERQERKEADAFDAFFDRAVEQASLPKRELQAFVKAYEAYHGYTPYLVS